MILAVPIVMFRRGSIDLFSLYIPLEEPYKYVALFIIGSLFVPCFFLYPMIHKYVLLGDFCLAFFIEIYFINHILKTVSLKFLFVFQKLHFTFFNIFNFAVEFCCKIYFLSTFMNYSPVFRELSSFSFVASLNAENFLNVGFTNRISNFKYENDYHLSKPKMNK